MKPIQLFSLELTDAGALGLSRHLEKMPEVNRVAIYREADGWRFVLHRREEVQQSELPFADGLLTIHAPGLNGDQAINLGLRLENLADVDSVNLSEEAGGWRFDLHQTEPSASSAAAMVWPGLPESAALYDWSSKAETGAGEKPDYGWSQSGLPPIESSDEPAVPSTTRETPAPAAQTRRAPASLKSFSVTFFPFTRMDMLDQLLDRLGQHEAVTAVELRGLMRGRLEVNLRLAGDMSPADLPSAFTGLRHRVSGRSAEAMEIELL